MTILKLATETENPETKTKKVMKEMIKAVTADAEAGEIDEFFVLAQKPDGELVTYAMGQTAQELVFDLERAKINLIVGATNHVPYEDDEDDEGG